MFYTNKIKEAAHFSSEAHKNQKRKMLNYPYISHPFSVLFLVSKFSDDEDVLVASLLHDTVEDCGVSLDEIESKFGKKVRDIVDILSEDSLLLDKEEIKQKQLERFKKANKETLLIKVADIIHNFCDIMLVLENYPKEIYLKSFGSNIQNKIKTAKERLEIIEKTWPDNPLLPEAKIRFEDYKTLLNKLSLSDL
jgi:(p)ppGpp synthase/HD superfamily hydrolase